MNRLSLLAPAKLNLFLHITGRRPDGYHNLQTLFQLLDYGDQLHLQARNDGELTLNPAIKGVDEQPDYQSRPTAATRQTASAPTLNWRNASHGRRHRGGSTYRYTLLGLNHSGRPTSVSPNSRNSAPS